MTKAHTTKLRAQSTLKMERNFDGLRSVLFDQLEGLVSGKTKPEVANSVARVSSEIIKSVSAQSDLIRLSQGRGFTPKTIPGIAISKS